MKPTIISPDLTGLIWSIPVILPQAVWFYLLPIATILVWSLHLVLQGMLNRIEVKTE